MRIVQQLPTSGDGTLQTAKHLLELARTPLQRVSDGSEQMNVDGRAAGTPVVLWNGTGGGDSGGDWTQGGSGSESSAAAHSGTYGLDSGVRADGDVTTFDNGSELDVDGTYDTITFWLQPKAFPTGSRLRMLWRDSTNTQIGSALRVDTYTSNMDLDVWQKVSIPIGDFALTADVQKLVLRYAIVAGQHLWFDDFELVASAGGGPYRYRVSAPTGQIYHVERLALLLAASDTGWSSTAFGNISGGLSQGLLIRYRKLGEEAYWKVNSKSNAELFGQLQVINDASFDGGDRLFVFALEPQLSSVVLVDDDEVIEIVVRDDLSSLGDLRAFLHHGVEEVP